MDFLSLHSPGSSSPSISTLQRLPARVLSMQSMVTHGTVGHSVALFPLQLLGVEVDPINSCMLSNHTGYSIFGGTKTTGDQLKTIMDSLHKNGFIPEYTDLLTGYMSSLSFLQQFTRELKRLKQLNSEIYYFCDPVLGDNNRLYVPAEFLPIYRDDILPFADILTPNSTEAELLSGLKIQDLASAHHCCRWFHERGVQTVVITSMNFKDDNKLPPDFKSLKSPDDSTSFNEKNLIHVIMSERHTPNEYLHFSVEKQLHNSSGAGDLTSALLLANLKRCQCKKDALEITMSSVQVIIKRSVEAKSKELLIIQSANDIIKPNLSVKAQRYVINE